MNIPSTFIFESLNKEKLPDKMLVVFLKNLFRYGRKDVKQVNGRVHLFLSYSPRNETVEEKVGKLPVRYLRVAADNEEELQLFIYGMQQFSHVNFYLALDESQESKKRIHEEEKETQEDEEEQHKRRNRKQIKILENRVIKPSTQQASLLSQPIEIYDDDADEFESQKYYCMDLKI